MTEFVEVADRVWVARYAYLDVNVSVVAGSRGLVVIDTLASTEVARSVLDDARRLSASPLLAAVNTHHHFDHSFGNLVFAEAGAELVCHEACAEEMVPRGQDIQSEVRQLADHPETSDDPADATPEIVAMHRAIAETEIMVPQRTFSSALTLDLGDRHVELVHPGRGHTSGDAVVRVPDADVVLAGDLVEESAMRSGVPGLGDDCYPMEWPSTLDLVLNLVGPDTVVVPGHGAPVDRDFVQEQRASLGVVAETIRDLAGRGVPLDQAVESADWPYPRETLVAAVRRGYEHLPRSQKRLPLI